MLMFKVLGNFCIVLRRSFNWCVNISNITQKMYFNMLLIIFFLAFILATFGQMEASGSREQIDPSGSSESIAQGSRMNTDVFVTPSVSSESRSVPCRTIVYGNESFIDGTSIQFNDDMYGLGFDDR